MTNYERSNQILELAGELHGELQSILERHSWNLAYRRAQEVVELTLKGLLVLMGVDYPKSHNPSRVFAATVRARGLTVPTETLDEIQSLARDLADKRAQAFYFEVQIGEDEARRAVEGATRVWELGHKWRTRLQPSEEKEESPEED